MIETTCDLCGGACRRWPADLRRHGHTYCSISCHIEALRRRRLGHAGPRRPRHGTFSEYSDYGCRCTACRQANAAHQRERRERQRRERRSA